MAIKVSATKLRSFQECPMLYWLTYHAEIKPKPPQWVKKVFGKTVHLWVERQYRLTPRQRQGRIKQGITQLSAKSAKSAAGMWYHIWGEALKEENANPRIFPRGCPIRFEGNTIAEIKEEKDKYSGLGAKMAVRYWTDNCDAPFPEAVEKRFQNLPCPGRDDIHLNGVIDQIRIIDGQYWIVDIKTSYQDYGEEDPRIQYVVHHDPQFTFYSWSFRLIYSTEEAGIIRYPLGQKRCRITGDIIDKNAIITSRGIEDYQHLTVMINFFVTCLEKGIFPRHISNGCLNCDYLEPCAYPELFCTKPVPVGKLLWGEIDQAKIMKQLEEQAELQQFSRPRLL